MTSAVHLADNMHRCPLLVIPCYEGRVENSGALAQASFYGSILPAAWSLMLALRSRGLGSAWTTLHLMFEKEAAAVLGIPDTVTQTCLLPVAYFLGDDFEPAKRLPLEQVVNWDLWRSTPGYAASNRDLGLIGFDTVQFQSAGFVPGAGGGLGA